MPRTLWSIEKRLFGKLAYLLLEDANANSGNGDVIPTFDESRGAKITLPSGDTVAPWNALVPSP